jgi:hypothetical protein
MLHVALDSLFDTHDFVRDCVGDAAFLAPLLVPLELVLCSNNNIARCVFAALPVATLAVAPSLPLLPFLLFVLALLLSILSLPLLRGASCAVGAAAIIHKLASAFAAFPLHVRASSITISVTIASPLSDIRRRVP